MWRGDMNDWLDIKNLPQTREEVRTRVFMRIIERLEAELDELRQFAQPCAACAKRREDGRQGRKRRRENGRVERP